VGASYLGIIRFVVPYFGTKQKIYLLLDYNKLQENLTLYILKLHNILRATPDAVNELLERNRL